ncbi:hypothetical protein [Pedobacter gandavensis]|uniref:Uncharacterized protein n=1 Tax=Pedobacter gandavensis TaxID=2679963 RepID=A0ABR6ERJ6_9SPHI|nr:hypothetical protein [Pedobacter gandavensis]MBB2147876.1 hypothetical protein [Pedobacter gandavensis]
MKRYVFILFLFFSFSGFAQTINNYKYVVVPEKFPFLKTANLYGLNDLAKFLIEQKGFTPYFDNAELPADLANNKCKALNLEVIERKTMFTTNLTLLLKDCQGNILFKSKEGKSREKEYKASYNFALRDAFTSLDSLNYVAMATPTTLPVAQQTPVQQTPVAIAPAKAEVIVAEGTLYAQPITNGFQLINTAPKVVLTLLTTTVQDYFIAKNETAHGIAFKRNGEWFFEYYQNNKLITEKLLIKF